MAGEAKRKAFDNYAYEGRLDCMRVGDADYLPYERYLPYEQYIQDVKIGNQKERIGDPSAFIICSPEDIDKRWRQASLEKKSMFQDDTRWM